MNNQEVIFLYEAVATITDQMLTAARSGDWDKLTALQARCVSQVDALKTDEAPVPLTGVVRERKVAIIQKILADDREIRNLVEPWMTELSMLINSTGIQRKLHNAYGARHSG
jgi:flagellar protein FliT